CAEQTAPAEKPAVAADPCRTDRGRRRRGGGKTLAGAYGQGRRALLQPFLKQARCRHNGRSVSDSTVAERLGRGSIRPLGRLGAARLALVIGGRNSFAAAHAIPYADDNSRDAEQRRNDKEQGKQVSDRGAVPRRGGDDSEGELRNHQERNAAGKRIPPHPARPFGRAWRRIA